MYAYADESGNTGLDVFSSQENFFLGALISINDLEKILQPVISHHQHRLGVNKIHATDIDFENLEEILIDVISAIEPFSPEFYFSKIDKKYYVSCQFFDIFFDSHHNSVIEPMEYYDSLFKHSSILELDKLLTLDEKRQFWQSLQSPKTRQATFKQITAALAKRISPSKNYLHERLHCALLSASQNIEDFDYGKFNKKLNSPNAIAFSGFLHRYHQIANETDTAPTAIIVDREQQFDSIFNFCREALEKIYMSPQEDSPFPSLAKASKFSLPILTIVDGSTSYALQGLDVILYISRSKHTKLKTLLETKLQAQLNQFAITGDASLLICASRIKAMQ